MRPIAIGLSPNLEADDALLSLKTLLSAWKWVRGKDIKKVENWFGRYFNTQYVFTFDTPKEALSIKLIIFLFFNSKRNS